MSRRLLALLIGRPPPIPWEETADPLRGLQQEVIARPRDRTVRRAYIDALQEAGSPLQDAIDHARIAARHGGQCAAIARAVAACCGDGDLAKLLRARIWHTADDDVPRGPVYVVWGWSPPMGTLNAWSRRLGVPAGALRVGCGWVLGWAEQLAAELPGLAG